MIARIVRIVVVNLALLLGMAAVAELVFGTWFSKDPLDQLGLPRGTRTQVSAAPLYPGGGEFVYRRDRFGLRGPDRDPARITILTIGGSTTNQLYLAEEQTWQQVMEADFRDGGRADVAIGNAGIDGQSTVGHLAMLRDWAPHIPGLHPRFILVYAGINDVQVGGGWIDTLRQPSLIRTIRQKSALFRMGRQIAGMVVAERARLRHTAIDFDHARWTDTPSEPLPPPGAKIAEYTQRLKSIAREIHALGAVPVFVTQPRGDVRFEGGKVLGLATDQGPNGLDQYNALAPYNAATLAVCRSDALLCLDLAREVRFQPGDFYDTIHNSPAGAARIGHWLHDRLAGLV